MRKLRNGKPFSLWINTVKNIAAETEHRCERHCRVVFYGLFGCVLRCQHQIPKRNTRRIPAKTPTQKKMSRHSAR